MSTHKHIDRICCAAVALAMLLAVLLMNGSALGIQAADSALGYEDRLFDTSAVHTIDIQMDDWEGFLEGCTDEEYVLCDLVIDGESCSNVAIRAKGNTSLTQVAAYGNDRYSFKIEFDHYDSSITYHGLDKLCLNNIIQDNTYMKDYLTYQMMGYFGVDTPLCSYVYLTVNGEDWGLYLAVEGVEEAFLERSYGSGYGELYKPDSMSMGGGRGNGGRFDMEDWMADREDGELIFDADAFRREPAEFPAADGLEEPPEDALHGEAAEPAPGTPGEGEVPEGGGRSFAGMGGAMGSSDVSLIYSDDDPDSYPNIFDNAKTDITDADKDRLIASLKQLNAGEDIQSVVDVDEVIRYFVVHNFVCNFDSYTGSMIHNYYLYEEDGRLSMIPWDYNLAFGGFQGVQDATSLVNYPIDTPVSGGTVDSRPMLAWIFADEEYTELYHQYFDAFIAQYFESGYFEQMMAQTRALIAPYVERDPTKFCTYEEFEAGLDALEQFCLLRAQSVRGQLEGTIPSTDEGQSQDGSALVDASSVTISDMGTMSMGGMGGMGDRDHGAGRDGGAGGSAPDDPEREEAAAPAADGGSRAPEESASEEPVFPADTAPAEQSGSAELPAQESREAASGEEAAPGPIAAFAASPGAPEGTSSSGSAAKQTLLLLGVSGGVLAAGVAVAVFYKKRG